MTSDHVINGIVLTDVQLLAMPTANIRRGDLTRFFALRASIVEREFTSVAPNGLPLPFEKDYVKDEEHRCEKHLKEEEFQREMQNLRNQTDRMLERIDAEEIRAWKHQRD